MNNEMNTLLVRREYLLRFDKGEDPQNINKELDIRSKNGDTLSYGAAIPPFNNDQTYSWK